MARTAELISSIKQALGPEGGNFVLVELIGGAPTPVYDAAGQLMKFSNGEDAARVARNLTDERGNKVQPRRVTDADWQDREERRMKDGTYVPLPWAEQKWWAELKEVHKDHFPHVSLNKTALIAFTEDAEKGSADVQSIIKPGRYLERFFGTQLNKYVVRDLCSIFASKYEDNKLQFADTEEDIEEVFTSGPTSCMSKDAADYKSGGWHPTRAYAAGDLQVAYLRRGGRIVARAVVWPAKKTYNVIYGDKGRMEPMLREAGFKQAAPIGARILKRKFPAEAKQNFTFIVPHVDNSAVVLDAGDYLTVAKPGDSMGLQCPGGSGHTEPCGFKCEECANDTLTARNVVTAYITEKETASWCRACAAKCLVICGATALHVRKDDVTEVKGVRGKTICWNRMLGKHTFRCAGTGNIYWNDCRVTLPDGTAWSADYAKKHAAPCHCGGIVPKDGPSQCEGYDHCLYRPQTSATKGNVRVSTIVGTATGTVASHLERR